MNCPTSEKHSSPDEVNSVQTLINLDFMFPVHKDDCPKAEVPEQQQQQEDDDNSLVAMSLIVGLSALFTTSIIGAVVMYRFNLSIVAIKKSLNICYH